MAISTQTFVALLASVASVAVVSTLPAKAEDVLKIQKFEDGLNFDPHTRFSKTTAEILPLLTDSLVYVDSDLTTIVPGLAKSWKEADDRKTYRFELRNDVTFCDGRAMTSADVVASFQRWMDPATKSGTKSVLGPLVSVEADGKDAVVFKLSGPYPDFLSQLGQVYAGIVDVDTAKKLGSNFGVTGFNGTGPYCWDKWTPRQSISLKKHGDYKWGPSFYENQGPAHFDKIVFEIRPEPNSQVAAMLSGQDDLSYGLPPSEIAKFKKDPHFGTADVKPVARPDTLIFRIHRPLMDDVAIRKAIYMSIDRDAIVQFIYYGEADPATFVVPEGFKGFDHSVFAKLPPFDPEAAKAVLEKDGWVVGKDGIREKGGKRLSLILTAANDFRESMEAVQGMLAKVGIELKVELLDTPINTSRITSKDDFDLAAYHGSSGSLQEFLLQRAVAGVGVSPYHMKPELGAEIDALIDKASTANSTEEQSGYQDKVLKIFADQFYWAPIVWQRITIVYNKSKVTGVKASGVGGNALYKGLDLTPVK